MNELLKGYDNLRRRKGKWTAISIWCSALLSAFTLLVLVLVFIFGIDEYATAPGQIRYQEVPDRTVFLRQAGILTAVYVKDGNLVQQGQPLGLVESAESLLRRDLTNNTGNRLDPEENWEKGFIHSSNGTVIVAPASGLFVARGDWDNGLGRSVGVFENLGSIVREDEFLFEAFVSGQDIAKVKPGQLCRIRIWPLSNSNDYVVEGRVLKVTDVIENSPTIPGYKVLCSMSLDQDANDIVRLGMDGRVKILVGNTNLVKLVLRKYFK